MSRSKARGTAFETAVTRYLADALGDDEGTIRREALHGTRDVGDIGGLRAHGRKVVVECKSYSGRDRMAQWLDEAETERGNADALVGVVISKRRGVGETRMGDQLVSMTLDGLLALVTGEEE